MTTSPSSPVLVIGATGKTGRRVAARLAAAGHDVRPASRSSATRFDWDDPATWAPALDGAGRAYVVPPETGDLDPFVAAVERSSVERVVHLSAREPTQGGGDDLARFEDSVRGLDRPWTILRPAWFDQNFDEGFFAGPLAEGTLRLPTGEGREPFIDAEDIAAVAVAALTEPGHEGRTYELSGPEPLGFADAVATIAAASGRDVGFEAVPAEAWATEPWVRPLPEPVIDVMQHLFAAIARGDNDSVSPGVEEALGRPPTPFATWAERTYRNGRNCTVRTVLWAAMDAEETAPADRPWLALAALTLPVLLISMDNTILGFAVPRLSESLRPSSSELLWIVDVYSFVLAGLLVTMGSLGDRIGRRRLLLAGAAAFSAASLLAAFATSAGALIAARAVLGLAGATLMPSTLSLIRNIFHDERQRATALAVWAAMFAVGAALGPIVGGLLLEHYWWGSVFLVGVPVTALLLVVVPRVVPESRDPAPGPFDLPSSGLSMVALVPLVYAVKTTAEHGPSGVGAAALAVGLAGAVAFVRRQQRIEHPMIDLALFRVPRFRMAVSANLVTCFGFAGSMFFVTQLLQLVNGLSPARAGLQLLPVVVVSVGCTLAAPRLARRVGPFAVIAGGLGISSLGFLLLSQADGSGLVVPTLAMVVLDLGFGAAMAVAIDGILAAIPAERAGAGASVSETAAELGIALGTAVLGSIGAAVYTRSLDLPTGLDGAAADTARDTLGAAELVARESGPLGPAVRQAAQDAFVDGMVVATLVAAAITAVIALWGVRIRMGERRTPPGSVAVPVGRRVEVA